MELSLTRDTVRVNDTVYEGVSAHPVDCEIVLPDYCPDIARILKTEADVCILSKTAEGSQFAVSGNLNIRIVYIPENSSSIRCVTHKEGFNHSVDLKEPVENARVRVRARVEFVNCRPIGPRRVQIKASVSLSSKVWVVREESMVSDCDNKGIELLKKPMRACEPVNSSEKTFRVNDEIEISRSKQPVASIIRAVPQAVVQDCKVIRNKVIAKGELRLRILYAGEDEESRLENVEHSIPISQIVDLDGAGEDCACEVEFEAGDVTVEPDGDSEDRLLMIEAEITAVARASREREITAVTDAYCTDHDVDLKTKTVPFENLAESGRYNEMVRLTADLPNMNVSSVDDCVCEPVVKSAAFEGKTLVVEGSMNVSALARDDNGSPVGVERAVPFTVREEMANAGPQMKCDPKLTVLSAECSPIGTDKLDIRAEVLLEAAVYAASNEVILTDMAVDDTREKECQPRKTITLYFADKGESVWEIAKRYNTSMAAIKRENSLEDEVLPERAMLLIPKLRCHRSL